MNVEANQPLNHPNWYEALSSLIKWHRGQYSTVQYSMYSTDNAVQYRQIKYRRYITHGTVQKSTVEYSTVQYSVVQSSIVEYSTV